VISLSCLFAKAVTLAPGVSPRLSTSYRLMGFNSACLVNLRKDTHRMDSESGGARQNRRRGVACQKTRKKSAAKGDAPRQVI